MLLKRQVERALKVWDVGNEPQKGLAWHITPTAAPYLKLPICCPSPAKPTLATLVSIFILTYGSAHEAWKSLSTVADLVVPRSATRDAFIEELASGALDGITVAYRTFDSSSITGPVDSELIPHLPSSLKFICHNGAGYDSIDVPACTARGIRVSNAPTAVDDSTADLGIWLMLGALRNLNLSLLNLRKGEWRGGLTTVAPKLGHDPQGKTLGILGMGGIGRNMAKKAKVFEMRILYYNRTRLSEEVEREVGAEYRGFEELLGESDVLSLNLPLNVSYYFFLTPLGNAARRAATK